MQADKVNPEGVELAERVYELPQRTSESVIAVHEDSIKLPSLRVHEEPIERRP